MNFSAYGVGGLVLLLDQEGCVASVDASMFASLSTDSAGWQQMQVWNASLLSKVLRNFELKQGLKIAVSILKGAFV